MKTRTTKTRKRRTRKKIFKVGVGLLLALVSAFAAGQRQADSYGMIGITVFRDSGFALPGAEVTLTPNPVAAAHKMKKQKGLSDSRGEIVFRVPTSAMRYTVRAVAKGFKPQEKSVSLEGEQRIDATFQLEPESK